MRARLLLWGILLVASCEPAHRRADAADQPTCVTACGLEAVEGSCETLQRLEDHYRALGPRLVPGWTSQSICAAFSGWRIFVHKGYDRTDLDCQFAPGSWFIEFDDGVTGCLQGYTDIDERTVEIDSNVWHDSSLPHELVHVIDYHVLGHSGHCNWEKRGVMFLLEVLTGHVDQSVKACQDDPPVPPAP